MKELYMNNLDSKKKLFIKSYGCQMNVYDSDRIKNLFESKDYNETESIKDADLIILNTCITYRESYQHNIFVIKMLSLILFLSINPYGQFCSQR